MFSEKWHYRFMEVARLIATWSKDPNTKTGAIVVGPDRDGITICYGAVLFGIFLIRKEGVSLFTGTDGAPDQIRFFRTRGKKRGLQRVSDRHFP